jgi:hypothetical protein
MANKTVWLKAGKADVRIGVKRKYISFRIIIPPSVRKRLLVQLEK